MSTIIPARGTTATPAHAKPKRERAQLSEGAKQERRLAFWQERADQLKSPSVTDSE